MQLRKKTQLDGFFNRPQPTTIREETKEVVSQNNSELSNLLKEMKELEGKVRFKREQDQLVPDVEKPEDLAKFELLITKLKQTVANDIEKIPQDELSKEAEALQKKLKFVQTEGMLLPKVENEDDQINWLRFGAMADRQLKLIHQRQAVNREVKPNIPVAHPQQMPEVTDEWYWTKQGVKIGVTAAMMSGNLFSWEHISVSTLFACGLGACVDLSESKAPLYKKGLIVAGVVGGIFTGGASIVPAFFGGLSGYLAGETVDQMSEKCCRSRRGR